MLLITSAPQAIPMQGPLVSQARWPMVYFVSFLFIGRVLLFKLITVSSMQIFKFTIEDAYLKRLSHRKRSARISFQMLKQDNVVSLETWRNIYITWHEHDVGLVRTSCFSRSLTHSLTHSSLLYPPRIPPLRLRRYDTKSNSRVSWSGVPCKTSSVSQRYCEQAVSWCNKDGWWWRTQEHRNGDSIL